jgi:hypothetical protein
MSGMTDTQIDTRNRAPHQVDDGVQVQHRGHMKPGRISSIHRTHNGAEYIVRTDPVDGGMGGVVNIWTTSGRSADVAPAARVGASR